MNDRDETFELADRGDDRVGLEDIADDADELDDDLDADDDFDDDLEEAGEEDVDFIAALYREDGSPVATPLPVELANDLEELIAELRRYPGDAGSLGIVSICQEFFVLLRVRGRVIQVLLSDGVAANDWPLARDIADYLGVDIPDEEDSAPIGDLDMLIDLGCPEFDLEQLCLNYDDPADEVALQIADKIKMGAVLRKIVD